MCPISAPEAPTQSRHHHTTPGEQGSGQQVHKEDGQANVQQDHHADEDGVGHLEEGTDAV